METMDRNNDESDILIEDSECYFKNNDVKSLKGKVVDIGLFLFEECIFAKAISCRKNLFRKKCPRCEQNAKYTIDLELETKYKLRSDNIVCENCLSGVVVYGTEYIAFGDAPEIPRPPNIKTSMKLN
jgi:hypothetical protein